MAKRRKRKAVFMSLDQYIKVLIPIIKLCNLEKVKNKNGYKGTQLWYLYRQFYYGFGDFLDWESRCLVSDAAKTAYGRIAPGSDLRKKKWYEQSDFDKGHQNGIFHLDHVFTGNMFRDAIDNIPPNDLSVEGIKKIIEDNYYVAWILKKPENKNLGRKKRGQIVQDAIKFYKKNKIYGVKLPEKIQ